MPFSEVNFSSNSDVWATPQGFFDILNAEFQFTLDVCAVPENAKCATYFSPEQDGLAQEWKGVVWCNPPYGDNVGSWVEKAALSAHLGATVVVLIFARTCTEWWHDYAMLADEIRLVKGRLRFGGAKNVAPSPSAVLIFRSERRTAPLLTSMVPPAEARLGKKSPTFSLPTPRNEQGEGPSDATTLSLFSD